MIDWGEWLFFAYGVFIFTVLPIWFFYYVFGKFK